MTERIRQHYQELKKNGFNPHYWDEQFVMTEDDFVEASEQQKKVNMVYVKGNKIKKFQGLNIGFSDKKKEL